MTPTCKTRRAFTLLELMIVVGVIVLLIAILLPSLAYAKRVAMKGAAQAQLSQLQGALAQYYSVFHVYPSSSTPAYGGAIGPGRGGAMLAEGLVGYLNGDLDGAGTFTGANAAYSDGVNNGFRMTNHPSMGGTIYGPYVSPDPKGYKALSQRDQYFIDPWGAEILYYRSTQSPPNVPGPVATIFGTTNSFFITTDCSVNPSGYGPNPDPATQGTIPFFGLLGANPPAPPKPPAPPAVILGNNYPSATITGADSFLLISAGPDGVYFTGDDIVAGKQ